MYEIKIQQYIKMYFHCQIYWPQARTPEAVLDLLSL